MSFQSLRWEKELAAAQAKIAALEKELINANNRTKDFRDGAKAEADAGDEARAELAQVRKELNDGKECAIEVSRSYGAALNVCRDLKAELATLKADKDARAEALYRVLKTAQDVCNYPCTPPDIKLAHLISALRISGKSYDAFVAETKEKP
jgi:chromosome segregation ATPase